MEHLKGIIHNAGETGIRCSGYNFSLVGVWDHQKTKKAREGAVSIRLHVGQFDPDVKTPKGGIWNMTYAEDTWGEYIEDIGYEGLWNRLKWFLEHALPAVKKVGVMIALHPDGPPMPPLKGTPRLVYQPQLCQKMLDLVLNPYNGIDPYTGSIQEMTDGSIYDALGQYPSQGKISYTHVRSVRGKVPDYTEVLMDDGDINTGRTLGILKKNHFEGVLIPDHTPQTQCQDA